MCYFFNLLYSYSDSTSDCQSIANIQSSITSLMYSQGNFILMGYEGSNSNLQIYSFTYLSTSLNWANKIV